MSEQEKSEEQLAEEVYMRLLQSCAEDVIEYNRARSASPCEDEE
jgi:hypothetical protein